LRGGAGAGRGEGDGRGGALEGAAAAGDVEERVLHERRAVARVVAAVGQEVEVDAGVAGEVHAAHGGDAVGVVPHGDGAEGAGERRRAGVDGGDVDLGEGAGADEAGLDLAAGGGVGAGDEHLGRRGGDGGDQREGECEFTHG